VVTKFDVSGSGQVKKPGCMNKKGAIMKHKQTKQVWTQSKAGVRQLLVIVAVVGAGAALKAADPSDLKTFSSEENYAVEGVSIVLHRKPGEATVKVRSAAGPADGSQMLTAPNGANFDWERRLGARGVYKMRSADPVSDAASTEAIDSLNEDDNIEYAYPVYVNAATGKRHFLNEEVVVRLKDSVVSGQTNLLSPFKLAVSDTLSAGKNICVLRLTEAKSFNPFQV
jgi:hypothetical protein